MKESEFIEQNKEKWLDFENNLFKKDVDPAKTSRLFIQITDDLSYARTFYKNRSVRLYLNGIANLLFNDLNKSDKKGFAGFLNFWKKDLPLTVYKSRRAMLISLFVFIACFILGVVTSIHDKDFAAQILSKDYVNMTNENIAKGDPMAVYKSRSEMETFLPIFFNNLKVDFITFFSGILMAIGTLVVMVVNGVMVGVFQYFFIERGLFWESFLGIWTHGALEISAIVISGGAGLTLGKGLLFPGTHSRFQAFKLSGMHGLKIILGIAPVTLLAAFIEGFLTRHTSIPDAFRFLFILLSFAFILIYFFIYPRRVAKLYPEELHKADNTLVYKEEENFDPSEIYTGLKLLTGTFNLFFKNFGFFARWIFIVPLLCSVLVAWNPIDLFHAHEDFNFSMVLFFNFSDYPMLGVIVLICSVSFTTLTLLHLKQKLTPSQSPTSLVRSPHFLRIALSVLIGFLVFSFIIFTGIDFSLVISQLLFPFIIFFCCISTYQNLPFYESMRYSGTLLSQSWGKFLLAMLIFMCLSFTIYATALYGLKLLFINDALIWMLTDDEIIAQKISLGILVFQTFLSYVLYLCLSVLSNSLLYFTLKETLTAEHLLTRIKAIKINK